MILITGVAGFIGSNLLEYLLRIQKEKIIGIDNLSRGSIFNIKKWLKLITFKKMDILSTNFLKLKEIKVIYHLASFTDARESFYRPRVYFKNIVAGTNNVLELVRKNDAKLIFASSAAVYGNYRRKVKESDEPKPISPYGIYKLISEKMIEEYCRIYGIKYSIFRLFNVYGKNAKRGIIKILLDAAYTGKPVRIFSGKQKRDFVYVDDVVRIFSYHERLKGIFNLGTGKAYSINMLVHLIEKLTNKNIKIIRESSLEGDILYSCADNSKLLSKINFEFTPLKKGLRLII
jgi:UDP-glucose 4-epimerase